MGSVPQSPARSYRMGPPDSPASTSAKSATGGPHGTAIHAPPFPCPPTPLCSLRVLVSRGGSCVGAAASILRMAAAYGQ